MGQIAHLGAGPLDDGGIGFDQLVELLGHRLDFVGELAFKLFGLALTDHRQACLQPLQRLQAEFHLHEDGRHQPCAKQGEDGKERLAEGGDLVFQLVEIAGHQKREVSLAAGQFEHLLHAAQLGAVAVG